MNITRIVLTGILSRMIASGSISLDGEYDIIDWEDEQTNCLTRRYLNACSKEVLSEILEEVKIDTININSIYLCPGKFISDLKEALYLQIENDLREPIINILTQIEFETEPHRRAEHERSQSEIY